MRGERVAYILEDICMIESTLGQSRELYDGAESPEQSDPLPAERRLCVEIIIRAIDDVRAGSGLAKDWIASQSDEPWSFRWLCEQIGYNAGWIRRKLALRTRPK